MKTKKQEKLDKLYQLFEITSVCRADLMNKEVGLTKKQALAIDDTKMERIASKMADIFVDTTYWEILKEVAGEIE